MGLLRLEKKGLRVDKIRVFQNLKGSYREDRGTLTTQMHGDRTRGNGGELFQGKFHLVLRKYSSSSEKTNIGIGCHEKR